MTASNCKPVVRIRGPLVQLAADESHMEIQELKAERAKRGAKYVRSWSAPNHRVEGRLAQSLWVPGQLVQRVLW